jgi:acetyltransferase-like isoleucine patch superfamily enzyme
VAIGAGVIAAPGAVIVRDVPDGVIVEGSPARVAGRRR